MRRRAGHRAAPAATGPTTGIKTVILTDSSRIARARRPRRRRSRTQLDTFKARPEVGGVVVDVATDPRIHDLNVQADAHTDCPYAKNLVADALKDIVDSYRTTGQPRASSTSS